MWGKHNPERGTINNKKPRARRVESQNDIKLQPGAKTKIHQNQERDMQWEVDVQSECTGEDYEQIHWEKVHSANTEMHWVLKYVCYTEIASWSKGVSRKPICAERLGSTARTIKKITINWLNAKWFLFKAPFLLSDYKRTLIEKPEKIVCSSLLKV